VERGDHIVSYRPQDLLDELDGLDADTLLAQARQVVAQGVVGEPITAADPVNVPMIRHYCQALGDDNPVYLDDQVAAGTRYGGLVAPPGMLGVWTMGQARSDGGPRDQVLRRLDAAGYTSVVATDYDQEFLAPLRPGDVVTETRSMEDLVGPKQTALGEGFFGMSRYDYHTADGRHVGVARMRLLKFRPRPSGGGTGGGAARPNLRPRPVINRDNRFWWDGVEARELRIQRCAGCADLRHPPGPMCPSCGSTDWDWIVASGRGTIASYVVHHHPPLPGVELPHAIVLVDLEEGVRLVSEVVDMSHRDVRIGMGVELAWKDLDDDLTVPAFHPAAGALAPPADPPRTAAQVAVGDEVPGFDVPMTPTFIISGALATRDFEDVHHDADAARRRGSQDLFPNILTSSGLAIRLVTDWLGPDAIVEASRIRLGLPAYNGELLQLRGEVTAIEPRRDRGDAAITVAVRGRISTGDHLSGTVVASLPMEA
jgi:uncharacterized protein